MAQLCNVENMSLDIRPQLLLVPEGTKKSFVLQVWR